MGGRENQIAGARLAIVPMDYSMLIDRSAYTPEVIIVKHIYATASIGPLAYNFPRTLRNFSNKETPCLQSCIYCERQLRLCA